MVIQKAGCEMILTHDHEKIVQRTEELELRFSNKFSDIRRCSLDFMAIGKYFFPSTISKLLTISNAN